MSLGASSAIPLRTSLSPSLAATRVRASERQVGGPLSRPIRRLPAGTFAFLAASLIIALMVAVAATAMEQPSASVRIPADATSTAPDSDLWCQTFNGRLICVGEPG